MLRLAHTMRASNDAQCGASLCNALVTGDLGEGLGSALPLIAASAPPKAKGRRSPAPAPQSSGEAEIAASARPKGGKRAAMLASAQAGKLPAPPDFTAETHKRFRAKLAEVVALVEAGEAEALAAWNWLGFMGSSMRAVMRYRDLALAALEARAAKAA
jgi:hypothetical protein